MITTTQKLSQKERLRKLFIANPGRWIPLPQILSLGLAQYGARIYELRREGMCIHNETRLGEDGIRRSYFRYLPDKGSQLEFL